MSSIFLISDTHFTHHAMLNFTLPDGTRMRPFATVEEMDEYMIGRWNATVSPQCIVYHLGDVSMHRDAIKQIARCNGKKRLVRGNHDTHKLRHYLEAGFQEVYGTRLIDDLLLSHIPVHPESIKRGWTNVHGHVHNNVPPLHFGPQYFNVSVEMINYTPIAIEDAKAAIATQHEEWTERACSPRIL